MKIGREDWIVLVDVIRRIYSKCLDNRESFRAIECINGIRRDIPPIVILTSTQQLAPWFNNGLDDYIAVNTDETIYTNDWISLPWVKYFEKHSAKRQQDKWHLLLMHDHGSHHEYEILNFCEDHKIKEVGIRPDITHLLQSLHVCCFNRLNIDTRKRSMKWYKTAMKTFLKLNFSKLLIAFVTKLLKN